MEEVTFQIEDELKEEIDTLLHDTKQSGADMNIRTVFFLRKLVSSNRWTSAQELINIIRKVGKYLIQSEGQDNSILNVVRRVLKIVREEYSETVGEENSRSESYILMFNRIEQENFTGHTQDLKSAILDSINELVSELETCSDNIAMQALEYIHSNEIIMTLGYSRTVEKFLKNAGRKRKFTVVVAENAPYFDGQKLAKSLAEKSSIDTVVITDSAAFGVMARVNKLILGAHLVMADGGVIGSCGTQSIAEAAKQHCVPVIVLAGLYKLSPMFAFGYKQENLTKLLSPGEVTEFEQSNTLKYIKICNPSRDFINVGLVDLFISDVGGNVPSYLYRLILEHYHQKDHNL